MAVETLKKVASQIALDNGIDTEGRQKTVNISLAGISASGFDADKYLAIVGALEPCLSKTVNNVAVLKTIVVAPNS